MSIKICRIDDRLIHGQVITTWNNLYQIEQIIIIDNALVNDTIQKSVLNMSIPAHIKLHIFSSDKFLEVTKKTEIKKNTMLLFSSIFTVDEIVNGGFSVSKLNIGGMRLSLDRKQLTKAVSMNEEEVNIAKKLLKNGVNVEIQMVPSEKAIPLTEVI